MGITKVAAATAALLAGIFIAVSVGAGKPDYGQSQRMSGETGSQELQAGYAVRGQAWATELFGRRYGRHLMAAAAPSPGEKESGA